MKKKNPITLGYWNIRGIAEPIRLLMNYLGVNYKDELYAQGPAPDFSREAWLKVRATLGLDFPNLPYLIDSPIKITESIAIIRYICHKFEPKLLGSNLDEIAYVDMITGVLYNFAQQKSELMYTTEPDKVPKYKLDSIQDTIKRLAKLFQGKKYLVGEKLTYVDFICVEALESVNDVLEPLTVVCFPLLVYVFPCVLAMCFPFCSSAPPLLHPSAVSLTCL